MDTVWWMLLFGVLVVSLAWFLVFRERKDGASDSAILFAGSSCGKAMIDQTMTTTAFTIEGYRIIYNCGLVRGILVRSRSIFGTIGGALQTLVGGNISLFSSLCERTRQDALEQMLDHAEQLGANAVIGIRYDATEIIGGVSEILCYGTAVKVERDRPSAH
jgi:uncharacterized protein YbjQ (UPF0145 family)